MNYYSSKLSGMLSHIDDLAWAYLTVNVSKYSSTGTLLHKYTIVNFMKNGVDEMYEYDGSLLERSVYLNGKLHGETFRNGIIKSKKQYVNGMLNGRSIKYIGDNEKDFKELCYYKNDILHGKCISYDRKINHKFVVHYINGNEHGQCKIYKNGLLVSLTTYVNGIAHGEYFNLERGERGRYVYGLKK